MKEIKLSHFSGHIGGIQKGNKIIKSIQRSLGTSRIASRTR